jgi:FkbM family methyltransferase
MKGNITKLDYILSRITPIEDLLTIMRAVKNWYSLLLFRFGIKKNIILVLKSGKKLKIRNREDYFDFLHRTKDWALELALQMKSLITINKRIIKVRTYNRDVLLYFDSATALGSSVALAIEQFIDEEYSWLDVKGKVVVDIGATVGDTAIYFAIKGAKHVYAVEPFLNSYNIAKRNIQLNKLTKKITLLNKALSKNKGFVYMKKLDEIRTGISLNDGISPNGRKIEILSLEDIVDRYKIKRGVLKLDCEGCEYESILNSSTETLRHFDQIALEYHYGYINIKKKLEEAGFEVKHTTPKYSGYDNIFDPIMYVGLIFAKKKAIFN